MHSCSLYCQVWRTDWLHFAYETHWTSVEESFRCVIYGFRQRFAGQILVAALCIAAVLAGCSSDFEMLEAGRLGENEFKPRGLSQRD